MFIPPIYRKVYMHPLSDDIDPTLLEIKVLSYRQILDVADSSTSPRLRRNQMVLAGLQKIHNIKDENGNKLDIPPDEFIAYLSEGQLKDIADFIHKISRVTPEIYEALSFAFDIAFHEAYSETQWSCHSCKEKKLQRARACPYLEEELVANLPRVKGFKHTRCPVGLYNHDLLSKAYDCYKAWEQGILIDSGGLYDQTEFFIVTSQLVKARTSQYQSEQMEKARKKK